MQAVAAVNHQIVVAQAAIANNQQQAAANAVAQQQIEQLQQQVAVAAANDQQQQQLSKMTNTAMSQIGLGSQQQPSAAAVSRAHMEAAVAQGQMNIAHSLAQAQAAAQSGMPVTPVLQVQQVQSLSWLPRGPHSNNLLHFFIKIPILQLHFLCLILFKWFCFGYIINFIIVLVHKGLF